MNILELLQSLHDAARGIGRGVANATADLVATPGDVRAGLQSVVNPALDRVFGAPAADAPQPRFNLLPTSEQARSALPAYDPQTELGRVGLAVGEMTPYAMAFPGTFRGLYTKLYGPAAFDEATTRVAQFLTKPESIAMLGGATALGGAAATALGQQNKIPSWVDYFRR